ncbi:MAG TPA: TonB-dependent receptor, partial [Bacteroidales bacterium]
MKTIGERRVITGEFIVLIAILLLPGQTFAQNSFQTLLKDSLTKEVLPGATAVVPGTETGGRADANGLLEIKNIPNGKQIIEFSYIGYQTKRDTFNFPLATAAPVTILLSQSGVELNAVVVQSTRSSRSIEDIPTRIDVIASDELNEEASMKPGEIKKLLTEGTGVTTQQTSAVNGTSNIRIQGLDGRYTQILRDGMPLYNGFSGGLSIMQIAPLDLQQVEFIKGSASTLYGGGAIAGLVNLISKTPQEKRELTFLLNGTSAKGFDGSGFYSQRWKKTGTTIFSSYNYNAPYDPANIGFTAIPQINRFTFNPKLFFYLNKKTTGYFGVNTTYENRYGGDVKVIEGNADTTHRFFVKNVTQRISTQLNVEHNLNEADKIQFKNSVGLFNRKISMPQNYFNGKESSSFSELNYAHSREKSDWVAGLNVWTDNFKSLDSSKFNYNLTTIGLFAQNDFNATKKIALETGLRVDYNTPASDHKLKNL